MREVVYVNRVAWGVTPNPSATTDVDALGSGRWPTLPRTFVGQSRAAASPPGYAERHVGPLRRTGQVPVRVIIDRSVLEVFANEGETVMTARVYPTQPYTEIEWIDGRRPAAGATRLMSLRSVW